MKTIARAGIAALLCVALATSSLFADVESDYQMLFGADEKKVAATRSTLDDAAFAKKLLQGAKALGDSPDLQKLVCQKAIDFGMKHHGGYSTAHEAIVLLARSFPDETALWTRKKFDIIERQYKTSYGSARKEAATAYLNALLDRAESLATAGKLDQALTLYVKAIPIATYARSERTKRIIERRRELAGQIAQKRKREAKLKAMEAKLAANPEDTKAREGLIRYHLCEFGDIAAAAKLLTPAVDESLRTYIPLAGKPLAELPEAACAELGHWYKSLAETATGEAKATMLVLAKACYARFLSLHTKRDMPALKVKIALKQVEADLVKAPPKKPLRKVAASTPTGAYTNRSGRKDVKEAALLARRLMAADPKLFAGKTGLDLVACYNVVKMGSQPGKPMKVAGAHAGMALVGAPGKGHMLVFGPYVALDPGKYVAVYRMRALVRVTGKELCALDVCTNAVSFRNMAVDARLFASRTWRDVPISFKLTKRQKVEIRIWGKGYRMAVDRLYVFKVAEVQK